MQTLFIEDLEKETGLEKRKIYNFIRRKEFYDLFGVESMSSLEDGVNNGSVSKVLTEEMYQYLKDKILGGVKQRVSDDDVRDVVYLIDLHHGFKMIGEDGKEQRRYKLGYTSKWLHERESNIQVSNPEARVVKYWKMSENDERTLHKYVDGIGCKRIGSSEVYDVHDREQFLAKIDEFFKHVSK